MTEIKERIQELNNALQLETDNLQRLEGIINETKNKIISIRGGIAELGRMQVIFDKIQKQLDEEGEDDEEIRDESE